MKKIGILTFYKNDNYGSSLQTFATMSFLRNNNNDVYVIDYIDMSKKWNKKLRNKTYLNRLLCGLRHPSQLKEMIYGKKVAVNSVGRRNDISKVFCNFEEEYLNIYHDNYTKDLFDYFIAGSDQVWKLTALGLHEVFFLRFANPKQRIAYAVSLGAEEIPSYNFKRLKKYTESFYRIGVREDTACKLLNNSYDVHATHVLDPVLLVGKKFWLDIMDNHGIKQTINDEYVFCYFLDSIEKHLDVFKAFINKNSNIKIILVDTGNDLHLKDFFNNIEIVLPDPIDFLILLNNAKYVFTDSFHGTAFSILFNKEFWTLPRNYQVYSGQKDRLLSLFRLTNLNDRMVDKVIVNNKIDYSFVNDQIDILRKKSEDFLLESIK